jgi:beta-glucosidase
MLYSRHQSIPGGSRGFMASTYNGTPFEESGAKGSDLSDQQKKFLTEDNLRHVLITMVESPEVAAQWNNNVQAWVEGLGLGIPANTSSDPRHGTIANAEFNAGAGGQISTWPVHLACRPRSIRSWHEISARLLPKNIAHLELPLPCLRK